MLFSIWLGLAPAMASTWRAMSSEGLDRESVTALRISSGLTMAFMIKLSFAEFGSGAGAPMEDFWISGRGPALAG